jgi:hypothetical protein
VIKTLLLILAVAVPASANQPEEAFEVLVDAFYAGDAQGVYDCLSAESTAMLGMMILMLKAQPAEAAAEISQELGVEITTEDIMSWTPMDLIGMMLSAPGVRDELPPRGDISVSGCEVNGDSCVVSFTVGDLPEPFELAMIRNGEDWKVDQSVLQAEL